MTTPTTPEDLIMVILVNAGLSREDETTQQLAGELANLYSVGMSAVELQCRINEIELSLTQKNKMLYGTEVQDDIGNRNLIDPNVLKLRLQGLRRMQRGQK